MRAEKLSLLVCGFPHFGFRARLPRFRVRSGVLLNLSDVTIRKFSAHAFGARKLPVAFIFGRNARQKPGVLHSAITKLFGFRASLLRF